MSRYVVIAQSPSVETSQVAGPFQSYDRAELASRNLGDRGYNTEIAALVKVADIADSPAWDFSCTCPDQFMHDKYCEARR